MNTSSDKSIDKYPLEIRDVDPDIEAKFMKVFSGKFSGFIRVGPKGYFLPKRFKEEALNIYNMELKPTDIFVASYPRSGTTWTQELVWMIVNNLDYETSNAIPLTDRYPFLEFSVFMQPVMKQQFQDENNESENKLELLENITKPGTVLLAEAPSPRFVKTHLPLSLLPPKLLDIAKVIYVARDPRDVAVSFYHLHKGIRTQGYIGDFKTYWQFFMEDIHYWTPYFEHLKEAWEKRHNDNLLFLFYEEMCKDLPASVRRISDYFGKKYSESEVNQLCNHLNIENFKQNKSVNYDVLKELGILQSHKEFFIRKGMGFDFSRIGPKRYVVSKEYETEAANIYNFPLRSDDVFVVTFPKSGTTWTQELVWLINNNLDYAKAKSTLLNMRCKFLELLVFLPQGVTENGKDNIIPQEFIPLSVDQIKELPSPRFIKSHLPLSLLPPNLLDETKVVYVVRDPRDVAVSFYHHNILTRVNLPDDDFKSFWNYFLEDKITWCPYFASVLEAWEKRDHPNMLFLYYEELSENLPGVIRRVAEFFGKQITDDQVAELREHLKFDNFKKNKSVNLENMQEKGVFTSEGSFLRKGKVGTWKESFDEDMTAEAEKWITENLRGSDFKFWPA